MVKALYDFFLLHFKNAASVKKPLLFFWQRHYNGLVISGDDLAWSMLCGVIFVYYHRYLQFQLISKMFTCIFVNVCFWNISNIRALQIFQCSLHKWARLDISTHFTSGPLVTVGLDSRGILCWVTSLYGFQVLFGTERFCALFLAEAKHAKFLFCNPQLNASLFDLLRQ